MVSVTVLEHVSVTVVGTSSPTELVKDGDLLVGICRVSESQSLRAQNWCASQFTPNAWALGIFVTSQASRLGWWELQLLRPELVSTRLGSWIQSWWTLVKSKHISRISYHIVLKYYIILYYIILYCTILYYIVLYCIILYYIILFYIILYYIILYYIILYYIILYSHISEPVDMLDIPFPVYPNRCRICFIILNNRIIPTKELQTLLRSFVACDRWI